MTSRTELSLLPERASTPIVYAAIPDAYTQPGLSLAQVWAIVWAYRKLSVLIAATLFTLTVLVVALLPRTYAATATLLVNYEVNDPLNAKEFPIGLLSSYMATQTELLRNPEVLRTVVERLQLTRNPKYSSGFRGEEASLSEYVQEQLDRNLTINQGQYGSQLIYISYATDDPAEAALVTNTVADVYKERDFVRSTAPAADRATRYAEQLTELTRKAAEAQEKYTRFRQENSLIDAGDRTADVDIALLNDLEQQLLDVQSARRSAQSRGAGDQAVGDQVMASTLIQTLKTQLATQQARLAELRTTLGERHPQVVEQRSQLAASRSMLNAEVGSYSRNAATGLTATRQLEQQLQAAATAQRTKVLAINALYDRSARYRLELESAQAVYQRALDGYDQVMFASAGNYTNVDFVSRATPPIRASKPRVLVLLLLGAMAGVGLGLFVPLLYELTHRRIRCRDDFERDQGVTVLAEFGPLPAMRGSA